MDFNQKEVLLVKSLGFFPLMIEQGMMLLLSFKLKKNTKDYPNGGIAGVGLLIPKACEIDRAFKGICRKKNVEDCSTEEQDWVSLLNQKGSAIRVSNPNRQSDPYLK